MESTVTELILVGSAALAGLVVWVYVDDRITTRKRLDTHDEEIKSLNKALHDLSVVKNDVEWIREKLGG